MPDIDLIVRVSEDDRCHYMNRCPNCGKRMANIVGFKEEESE